MDPDGQGGQKEPEQFRGTSEETLRYHGRSLYVVHQSLKDHAEKIHSLELRGSSHEGRVTALENGVNDDHRQIQEIKSEIDGVTIEQKGIRALLDNLLNTSMSSREMIEKHINDALLSDAKKTRERMEQHEKTWTRIVRISAVATAIMIGVMMILNALKGGPMIPEALHFLLK